MFGRKDKVLVTGASGFIGKHLVKRLKQDGNIVVEVTRENFINIEKLIKGVKVVYHLASKVPFAKYEYSINHVNYDSELLKAVINACSREKVKKFIFTSGRFSKNDNSLYALSKQASEQTIENLSTVLGLPYVILRFPGIYGKGQRKTGFIHRLAIKSLRHDISKDLNEIYKNYMEIDEAIDLLVNAPNELKNTTVDMYATTDLEIGIAKYAHSIRKTIYFDLDGTLIDLHWRKIVGSYFVECPKTFKNDKLVKGTKEVLKELKNNGYFLVLITKRWNRELLIKQIKKLGLNELLDVIINTSGISKQLFMNYHVGKNAAIVGDTEDDIIPGKFFRIKTIAVLSGLRNREQLKRLKPDIIIKDIRGLLQHERQL